MSIKETFDTNCSTKQLILSARKSTTHEILLHQISAINLKKAEMRGFNGPLASCCSTKKNKQYFCTNILSMS